MISMCPLVELAVEEPVTSKEGSESEPWTLKPVMARIWAIRGTSACLLAMASLLKHVRMILSSLGISLSVLVSDRGLVSGESRRLPRAGRCGQLTVYGSSGFHDRCRSSMSPEEAGFEGVLGEASLEAGIEASRLTAGS